MPKLTVIGCGPGSKGYATPAALQAIEEADVLIGGKRLTDTFAKPGQKTYSITKNTRFKIRDVVKRNKGKKTAFLAAGDAGLYGILNLLRRYFKDDELEVIPGISSAQYLFARLKMPWHDVLLESVHGLKRKEREAKLLRILKHHSRVALFTDDDFPPKKIATFLLKNGVKNLRVAVGWNLSYDDEKIYKGSLGQLAKMQDADGGFAVMVTL